MKFYFIVFPTVLCLAGCNSAINGFSNIAPRYGFYPSFGKNLKVGQVWKFDGDDLLFVKDVGELFCVEESQVRRYSFSSNILGGNDRVVATESFGEPGDAALAGLREAGVKRMEARIESLYTYSVSSDSFASAIVADNPDGDMYVLITDVLMADIILRVSPYSDDVAIALASEFDSDQMDGLDIDIEGIEQLRYAMADDAAYWSMVTAGMDSRKMYRELNFSHFPIGYKASPLRSYWP
ncbi:MAG: hypothetical protein ACIAQF_05020 [Phycisphaerales bacterium JB065]